MNSFVYFEHAKDELSRLLLDDTFDPSPEDAQNYLLTFCERLFANEFVSRPSSDYECPMNEFNAWLQNEFSGIPLNTTEVYRTSCDGASGKTNNSFISLTMDQ